MKIATFGSCLSRFTAMAYCRMFDAKVVGSVYHNRIDRFVKTYVSKKYAEPSLDLIGDYETGASAKGKVIMGNQLSSKTLGRHGNNKGKGFMAEIDQKVDLVIMDNFIDVVGKLCHIRGVKSAGFFINPAEIPRVSDKFVLDPVHLDVDEAVESWVQMINWIRARHKGKVFFLNFPFSHHPKTIFDQRAKDFERKFSSSRINVVPSFDVVPSLLESNSHFDEKYYAMMASYIWSSINTKKTASQIKEGAADNDLN